MLRDELLEMIELFDLYNITEENQRRIIENGIYFDFTRGSIDLAKRNKRLTPLEFAKLLKMCATMHIPLDANDIIERPIQYEYLIGMLCNLEELNDEKSKTI